MPSLLNTVKDLDRLRRIVSVLVRHGFGEIVQRTGLGSLVPKSRKSESGVGRGERLKRALVELGPSFIKLGQIASTRPDILPADIVTELKTLQDEVPPEPWEVVQPLLEGELGGPVEEIFESFDNVPLASASIAQVHRARLKTAEGDVREVVVKVQRPQVREIIELDLDLLYWFAHAIERSIPEMRMYQPVKLVGEFDRAISAELDFVAEADHADRFRENFKSHRSVRFPQVYREASSRRVLVLEFFDGLKLGDAIANHGFDGEVVAKVAIDIIIQQIFEDGFFHADPHPGNLFIMGTPSSPVIAMFDLGLVGHLTPKLRDQTIDLMVAAVREDYRGIADALWAIGSPSRRVDREAFEAEVTIVAQKYLGKKLKDIELSALLKDLVDGARRFDVEVPSGFLMMGKALMTVEGIGKEIYPDLDIFNEVRPYFLRLIQQRYSPERVTQDVIRGVLRLSNAASDAPLQIQEILEDARRGTFRVQVQERSLREAADRLGRRLFSGLVVSAGLIGGCLLLAADKRWTGWALLIGSGSYAMMHSTLVYWLNRRDRVERD